VLSGVPTLSCANPLVNVMPPRQCCRLAVAAAGEETTEPADHVSERDARREHVARRPQRQTDAADVPQRNGHGEDEAAVEYAAGSREGDEIGWIRPERAEIGDEQEQLRADERADDDVDAEVEDPIRVEAARLGADHGELEPEETAAASSTP
jgi:hypothetical protein